MRKKLFAILMSAMMMVTFMPTMAFADINDPEVKDGTWAAAVVFDTATYSTANLELTAAGKDKVVTPVTVSKDMNSSTGLITATAAAAIKFHDRRGTANDYYYVEFRAANGQLVRYKTGTQTDLANTATYYDLTGSRFVSAYNSTTKAVTDVSFTADTYADFKTGATQNATTGVWSVQKALGDLIELAVPENVTIDSAAATVSKVYVAPNFATFATTLPTYQKYESGNYEFGNSAKKSTTAIIGAPVATQTVAIEGVGTLGTNDVAFTIDGKAPVTESGRYVVTYNGNSHPIAVATKGVKVEYYDAVAKTWSETAPEVKAPVVTKTYNNGTEVFTANRDVKVTWRASLTSVKAAAGYAYGEFTVRIKKADIAMAFAQKSYKFAEGYAIPVEDIVAVTGLVDADKADFEYLVKNYVKLTGVPAMLGTGEASLVYDSTKAAADHTLDAFLARYDISAGSAKTTIEIVEAKANKVTVSTKTINAKAKKAVSKKISADSTVGNLTFKKVSGNKKITVAENGKVTVKKGLKKGKTYTLKVKVSATGNYVYGAASKTATIKVKVK